jgi:acyl-CoA thioester hydrolase
VAIIINNIYQPVEKRGVVLRKKIYYHHTDSGGVVYYAEYLKFLEEARTELLEEKGISIRGLADKGVLFVVSRQEIDYKSPAVYGDILEIDSKIIGVSPVRIEIECLIKNQNGILVSSAKTVLACVGKDFLPRAIPEETKKKLV